MKTTAVTLIVILCGLGILKVSGVVKHCVRLINIKDGDSIASVSVVANENDGSDENA